MKLEELNETYVEFGGVFDSTYEHQGWREKETANVMYVLLNGEIFAFKEDPDDGYRSICDIEESVERPQNARFSLEHTPIKLFARVGTFTPEKDSFGYGFEGLRLYKERDSKEYVAQFGTDDYDDYYPSYTTYIDVGALND